MDIIRLMLLSRQMKNRRHEKNNMVTGIPPLTFIANKTGLLKNYRIYGNTENGESVGDKTANLFDMSDYNPDGVTANEDGSFYKGGYPSIWAFSCKVETGKTYTLKWEELYTEKLPNNLSFAVIAGYHKGYSGADNYIVTLKGGNPNQWHLKGGTFTATDDYISIAGYRSFIRNIMLVEGSTAMDYEPYGYKIPITITADSAETTDIYLDEPLAKSGNNADYIDYMTQKRHNSDGTESSVTLPEIAVTAGTNTLTIGTEVQPSRVELTGRIKEGES